jgi:hypothetical protein
VKKNKVNENTVPGLSIFKASDWTIPKQKEFQTLNQRLKRNMEIPEEILKLKKRKRA